MKKLMSAALACAILLPSVAATAADFTDKTVEFWVPFREGGGTDTWARALQPFISEKLPGNPDVIIVNETTGGAIGGSNEFHRRMEPGGEMIFGTTGSVQFPFLLGDKRVRYDYADWTPVLASPVGGMVYLRTDSGVNSVDDFAKLKDMDLVFGSQAISTLDLVPLLAFEMLGLDVQAVFGMKSRALTRQAIQRNEVNIDYQTTPTYLKHVVPLVEEGEMVPFMSLGALQADGTIGRDPTFPDVPSFPEVYEKVHGKKPSGPAWDSWKAFFTAGYGTQKFIVLPKSSDQDVIDTYRAAMKEVAADPRAQKVLKEALGNYEVIVGDQVVQAMQDATVVPEEAQAWITNWLKEKYNFSN